MAVLLGPFLDARNPHIAESEQNFDSQWHGVLAKISEATCSLETEVVLVASARDLQGIPVYPQPPLQVASPSNGQSSQQILLNTNDKIGPLKMT